MPSRPLPMAGRARAPPHRRRGRGRLTTSVPGLLGSGDSQRPLGFRDDAPFRLQERLSDPLPAPHLLHREQPPPPPQPHSLRPPAVRVDNTPAGVANFELAGTPEITGR